MLNLYKSLNNMVLPAVIVVAAIFAQTASAHFVFIVPAKDAPHTDAIEAKPDLKDAVSTNAASTGLTRAHVIMSETLEPDDQVDAAMLKGLSLFSRDLTGLVTQLTLGPKEGNALTLAIPGRGTRVIFGRIDFGHTQRGKSDPHILIYHPKSILGDAFEPLATLNHPVIELIPVGRPGSVQFQLNIQGKPAPKTQVVVVLPDGSEKRVVTDEHGLTSAYDQAGSYGVWARFWQDAPGQRDGKPYDQLRHYATLAITVP